MPTPQFPQRSFQRSLARAQHLPGYLAMASDPSCALQLIHETVQTMAPDERVLIDDTKDNEIRTVRGFGPDGSNGDLLREVLKTTTFGMLPLLEGSVKSLSLWYDDDANGNPPLNEMATKLLGDQVCGGKLYGPVLVGKLET